MTKLNESLIAAELAMNTFNKKYLMVVPNCYWTGNECDLLIVTENLRIIDIEIKTSKSDLFADLVKDKWFQNWDYKIDGPRTGDYRERQRKREWPKKVWKHYYVMPSYIWDDKFLEKLPNKSGIMLINEETMAIKVIRKSSPNKDAKQIDAEDAIDIARLISLRMWNMVRQNNSKT